MSKVKTRWQVNKSLGRNYPIVRVPAKILSKTGKLKWDY